MKKILKFWKKKLFVVSIATFILGMALTESVFATDFELELTDEYEKWNNLSTEEKSDTIMPQSFSFEIPESVINEYSNKNKPSLVGPLVRSINLESVSATILDSRFNLADNLNIRVENQGVTNECWAFSIIKSMETNIALTSGVTELKDFSERHMDYSSVKTFTDGTNENGLDREAGDGGLPIMGLAYLTNGQGAVTEEKMPFENNIDKISLKDLDKEVSTIVTDYELLPSISKEYVRDSNGNTKLVTYKDSNGNAYTDERVETIRYMIKQYLIDNGAITGFTAGSKVAYYNAESIFDATAYNCNNSSVVRDHAITIVGWDDNYSKDNFKEGTKPSTDGAYIVLNSYGESNFDNGYIYISYEDFFIESELYGISATSDVDYDNIYQYDNYGGILKLGASGTDVGYYATTFDRSSKDSTKIEKLTNVAVSVSDYVSVEIYLNPDGTSLESDKLVKVGSTDKILDPGYHRIDVTPTEITGDTFAIVIKQTAEEGTGFSFEIETAVEDTDYSCITSENRSFISMDGDTWTNLCALEVNGIDMKKSDVCIKAFTVETDAPVAEPEPEPEPDDTEKQPEENPDDEKSENSLSSKIYKIENEYIMNISYKTTKETLLNNVETSLEQKVLNKDGEEISNNDIIKTGMKLVLSDNTEYILIIRGDTNCDGNVTLTDLSKLVLHYNEMKGFELTGNALKAADLNIDGNISLVDLSQLIVLYNSI